MKLFWEIYGDRSNLMVNYRFKIFIESDVAVEGGHKATPLRATFFVDRSNIIVHHRIS
jgi:hypothetical protein